MFRSLVARRTIIVSTTQRLGFLLVPCHSDALSLPRHLFGCPDWQWLELTNNGPRQPTVWVVARLHLTRAATDFVRYTEMVGQELQIGRKLN